MLIKKYIDGLKNNISNCNKEVSINNAHKISNIFNIFNSLFNQLNDDFYYSKSCSFQEKYINIFKFCFNMNPIYLHDTSNNSMQAISTLPSSFLYLLILSSVFDDVPKYFNQNFNIKYIKDSNLTIKTQAIKYFTYNSHNSNSNDVNTFNTEKKELNIELSNKFCNLEIKDTFKGALENEKIIVCEMYTDFVQFLACMNLINFASDYC